MKKYILITGAAGFIGSFLCKKLLTDYKDLFIIGIDNLNDYYDVNLKINRLKKLQNFDNFEFIKCDIGDKDNLTNIFRKYNFQIVVNLAAQAGVRYSITNPDSYIKSNIIGFYNILEACREHSIEHLVFASSSSVYGGNTKVPFSEEDFVDHPVSLYAATKKSNELLAHSYAKLYNIPSTGLRFFTVYGPEGRPDMAYFSFTNKLVKNEKIDIFNYGNCERDFTYIDDIIDGIVKVIFKAPERRNGTDGLPIPPYKIYNIGNSSPENLLNFVNILSEELIKAKVLKPNFNINSHLNFVPMQPGDVVKTFADVSKLEKDFGYRPETSLRLGLQKFAEWYFGYYCKGDNNE